MMMFLVGAGGFVLGWLCASIVIIVVGDQFDIVGFFIKNRNGKSHDS